ncbi:hypothetical protein IP84_02410 [beta proteobacterium AAP99]|nr:hypothetical protein IP84_02410 [beta proteobacterium AAP99]
MNWFATAGQKRFIRNYGDALRSRDGALFVGAGVSRAAGFVDWKALLRDLAADLDLDVDRETDLVALAQFHLNSRGTRAGINQALIDGLTDGAVPTKLHDVLARLPVDTVWTTYYDQLLEQAFAAAGKAVDVKLTIQNLAQLRRGKDVTLYKMHGCVTQPQDAVLTKDDYERYADKRALFSDSLKGDLIEKTLLFLGFSFTDPNIEQILSRVRGHLGTNQRDHYCVMRRRPRSPDLAGAALAEFEYEARKAEYQVADLKRFGIQTVSIEEYEHLTPLLQAVAAYTNRDSVFVSGAAADAAPLGPDRLHAIARRIGQRLITDNFRLVSGFGTGIGEQVALGALRALFGRPDPRDPDRVVIRPFPAPSSSEHQAATYTRHREDLLSRAGAVVVIAGNKASNMGGIQPASGVVEEVRIAQAMGKIIIPIGVTGHVAADVWTQAMNNPELFLPGLDVQQVLSVLGDETASDDSLIDAVFEILDAGRQRAAAP